MTEFSSLRQKASLSVPQTAERLDYPELQTYRGENNVVNPHRTVVGLRHSIQPTNSLAVQDNHAFTFIDLFAGIGGLRLGFESIGGKCIFTSEWDKYCNETYRANFPGDDHKIAGDIRPYGENPALIPPHDVLLAGFPCQPFSLAGVSKKNALGRPHGFDCEKQGTLFFEIERIIAHHRPSVFLLENVKNLESHDKGRTFEVIMDTLKNGLKYKTVLRKVISSVSWVPQKRERIFIVGFREDSKFTFDDFVQDGPNPRLGSILNGHNSVPEKYTLTAHLWQYLQDYKKKHESKGNGFGCSVFGPKDITRTLSARYYKDGSEILIEQKGTRPRRLMPDECARLMGFAHHDGSPWKIPVSDTQAYKQFGNAVVVPVVKAVAHHMEKQILAAVTRDRAKVIPLPVTRKMKKVFPKKPKKAANA